MKKILLSSGLLLASFGSLADDYSGHWRGVLELAPGVGIVLGVNLSSAEQGYQLELLSPNQHSQPILPSSMTLEGTHLKFAANSLRASFDGRFAGETLAGVFTQGRAMPITLTRLSKTDLQRLEHEQQWAGDLALSNNASLPLVLNVAVIAGGYHVTLDSPKQQSYGIPVDQFSVSDSQLNFSAKMISASYQGQWQQDQWQGTFIQGRAMPLNFKKKP
ncbi:MAG: hypothetical protein ACK4GU_01855 [Alishewanella aestuarii]